MLEVSGYLARLGLPADLPPTLESLMAIHRAHVERVPYNNLEIMLGAPPSVEPFEALGRLVSTGRSGYCFHQNGSLELVLRGLGFEVHRRHGHVWRLPEHREQTELNHLVLLVSELPTAANPGGWWWPDVGLGDGILEPLPLVAGPVSNLPFDFVLSDVTTERWSFTNDPRGSFSGVEICSRPVDQSVVSQAHAQLSTLPAGAFTKLLVVQRRDRDAAFALRGCVVTRTDAAGTTALDLTRYDDWRDGLASLALAVADLDEVHLRGLFERSLVAHQSWDDAGRP